MFFQIQIWFLMNCGAFFGLHIPPLLDWFCTTLNIFFFSSSHSILRCLWYWYWCSSGLIVWSVLFSFNYWVHFILMFILFFSSSPCIRRFISYSFEPHCFVFLGFSDISSVLLWFFCSWVFLSKLLTFDVSVDFLHLFYGFFVLLFLILLLLSLLHFFGFLIKVPKVFWTRTSPHCFFVSAFFFFFVQCFLHFSFLSILFISLLGFSAVFFFSDPCFLQIVFFFVPRFLHLPFSVPFVHLILFLFCSLFSHLFSVSCI